MMTFVKNILPRLQEYSKTLDHAEILIDQPWVVMDDTNKKQQYIFQRNGSLIFSSDGNVLRGTWEYISAAQSLLIEVGEHRILLKHAFVDPGVLILKKDGFLEQPWIAVNERVIPDLNLERYLIEMTAAGQPLPPPQMRGLARTSVLEMSSGETFAFETKDGREFIEPGTLVFVKDQPVLDGTFRAKTINLFLVVRGGEVRGSFSEDVYDTDRGTIYIRREVGQPIRTGDRVLTTEGVAYGKYRPYDNKLRHSIWEVQEFVVKDGLIGQVKHKNKVKTFFKSL